jgi:hypothetical protein
MRAPQLAGHASGRRRSPHAILRPLAAVLAMAALAIPVASAAAQDATAGPAVPSAPLTDSGYWAVADQMQQLLDNTWDENRGEYRPGGGGADPMVNSLMLLTHSVAAMQGHDGPARNDHRARLLAKALVSYPTFVTKRPAHPKPGSQVHAPGWTNSLDGEGQQHLVFDAEVVDGLVYAWRARKQLDLPQSTADAIAKAIDTTARGKFWRYPTIRLNQINWYALMYEADATVTGKTDLVRNDMRNQIMRFVRGMRGDSAHAGNVGPGMRFHYLPNSQLNHPMNVDSAEYANIVLSFSRFYEQARHQGMKALPTSHVALLRQWTKRVIDGYWTHSGYMNWDTGFGFERWHQAKKLGLTQQALIGIAQANALQPTPDYGKWSKWFLDRSLTWYAKQAVRADGLPDPVFFKLYTVPQTTASARLAAARVQANAARAIDAGLGHMAAAQPPSLYSFDPDTGRLAVTTPSYNTAVVPVNQRAFPYGGIELARLFDGEQDVAANVGGRAPAAFGMRVQDSGGRQVLSSQVGRSAVSRGVTPLRLTKAPVGAGATASAAVGHAYAGPFTDLRATGTVSTSTLAERTTHRFTPRYIDENWSLTRTRGSAHLTASVLFPSWGSKSARVVAVLKDGTRVSVASRAVSLARVAYLQIVSEHSGYVIVPRSRPAGAVARVLHPSRQSSDPDPGPTLAVELARSSTFRSAGLAVRLAPADESAAAQVVASLGVHVG